MRLIGSSVAWSACSQPAPVAPVAIVGASRLDAYTGNTQFVPLTDGAWVPLAFGPQGGWMLVSSVLVRDMNPTGLGLELQISSDDGEPLVAINITRDSIPYNPADVNLQTDWGVPAIDGGVIAPHGPSALALPGRPGTDGWRSLLGNWILLHGAGSLNRTAVHYRVDVSDGNGRSCGDERRIFVYCGEGC